MGWAFLMLSIAKFSYNRELVRCPRVLPLVTLVDEMLNFNFWAFLDNSLKNGFKMILVSGLSVTNAQCSKFSFKRELTSFPWVLDLWTVLDLISKPFWTTPWKMGLKWFSWLSVTNTQCSKFSFKREITRFPRVLALVTLFATVLNLDF